MEREAEVVAVSLRRRGGLVYDAATWAAVRRRALAKAVEYNEAVLTRLRARLDALPPPPSDQRSNGAGHPGGWTPGLTPPASAASEAVAREAAQPPVEPERSARYLSPWLPRAVAEAHHEAPEVSQQREMSHTSLHSQSAHSRPSTPRSPSPQHRSEQRIKPSENVPGNRKRRRLLIAVGSILLLAAVVAGGALLFHGARSSPLPRTAPPSAAARAFALPVLRNNRPRPFSIVLTRMALVTRASVVRTVRASAAPQSGRRVSQR